MESFKKTKNLNILGKQCSKCHKLDHFANACRTDFQVTTLTKTVIKKEQLTVKYHNHIRHCNKCGRNSHGHDEVCPAKGILNVTLNNHSVYHLVTKP